MVPPPSGLPSSFEIMEQHWPVQYSAGLTEVRDCYGVTLTDEQRIVMDTNMSREKLVATLLHELLHACYAIQPDTNISHEQQEKFVDTLAPALLSFLRSNGIWWLLK